MRRKNIVSVSWGDHLAFGEGDGRLDTPDALARRMAAWREELGAVAILWRQLRTHLDGKFTAARGYRHPSLRAGKTGSWDEHATLCKLAKETGLRVYLYVSLFDDGFPLAPKKVREVSYHNAMHWRHVSWQSRFSREHPEYAVVDRTGNLRQWGVLCLGYREVRAHFRERFLSLLDNADFDGLFVCLRSQSRPADFADQFGFNEPVCRDFQKRYGRDIRRQDFDLQQWRNLNGGYLTQFFRELAKDLRSAGLRMAVGAPRGDVIGPPMGNTTLDWRTWLSEGIVDDLVVNQNSSQCPSMWHHLWPMHRGYGYVQNAIDGHNMPPLVSHIETAYAPVVSKSGNRLFIARMWDDRSQTEESHLLSLPAVSGLVFSSFRHDNPGPLARGDWRA